MKKALIASTALVLSAGVAAADVTFSGFARTGLDFVEGREQESQIQSRVRLNVLATTSTDQGVDFGARLRFQWDQGESELDKFAPGQIYVTASGLTVSVGNVGTAFDSAGLLYASEIGIFDRSLGNPAGSFFAYSTGGYGANNNRVGIAATYAVDALTARISYVNTDQTISGGNEEIGVSVDYSMDAIALSAAAVLDGAGIDGNDQYFLGAAYTLPGTENKVGLNWIDNGDVADSTTFTLYGEFEVAPLTTVKGYVANNDAAGNATDIAYGIGGRYDLGGAYLATAIHRDYNKDIIADFGVRFNF
ncbi:porin [Paracoccus sp. (in: a-proteobacteria)]|uniref:porin n=1 Tax=Paracoccus sp. TaxID=267 RepID=UPI00272D620F|nr:porin [Paracoccus sp. (in: a-proteobacteria)]